MKAISLFHNNEFHLTESDQGKHLFVVNGSKIYDLPVEVSFQQMSYLDYIKSIEDELASYRYISNEPLAPPKLAALSLNVAQGCNLSCNYCYADEGKFKRHSRLMSREVSFSSIDRLFDESDRDVTITIGYMGGEPLLNRELVHESTKYASQKAKERNQNIKFSITTNGTLLTKEDVKLFNNYPYTVTISLDGPKHTHDQLRKKQNGKGSYDSILDKLELFDVVGRPQQLIARATVTPKTIGLLESLDHLVNLKFDDVGFSPVLVSPNPNYIFHKDEFDRLLEEMIICGEKAVTKFVSNQKYPFGNLTTALLEIHKGTYRPYPCGAGASYMSVNAEGDIYACHRLIDDEKFYMGDINKGLINSAREELLTKSFVDSIKPCNSCWARYLCGGGCYHEVKERGRIGCDYIRGWLTFCVSAYTKIQAENPAYFGRANTPS